MERIGLSRLVLAGLLMGLTGCVSVPRERGTAEIDKLIAERGGPVPAWPQDSTVAATEARAAQILEQPIGVLQAVELAFLHNPRLLELYAELGIAQADVLEASRLGNPTLGYVNLRPNDRGRSQITRSISFEFADLLLLPARARLARNDFERARHRVGASLVDLEARVETAWFEYVSAQQVAEMRQAVARTAAASGELAQRMRDAGNLTPRALALEMAAASEARVAAARATADVIRARSALAQMLGVSSRDPWRTTTRLPAPLPVLEQQAGLVEQALAARLDVAAARREVDVLESGLGMTRRWRWLGVVEVGYEHENETDGSRLRGPSLAVQVPIFHQNQSGVLRAQAQLEAARARLAALELAARDEVSVGLEGLTTAHGIAEAYRVALVPQREAVVARTLEEFNFMLVGAFELLQAKRAGYDAYQEYLEAVRDYWLARTALRRAAGGKLAGDEAVPASTIGVEDVLAPKGQSEETDHSRMDHSGRNEGETP